MWTDTDAIAKAGLIDAGWQGGCPTASLPYSSTIVFVVRKGNPKRIKDWPDLVREGVAGHHAQPENLGQRQAQLLAAWGSVVLRGGSEKDATDFVTKLYQHVPVLDSGARARHDHVSLKRKSATCT